MIRIHSLSNDRVRRVLALQRSTRRRQQESLIVAEGHRLIEELAGSSVVPVEIFFTQAYAESGPEADALLARLVDRAPIIEVSDEVMTEMADTVTPQGILAVAETPNLLRRSGEASDAPAFFLIPDQVRDPGNLGTMLRTAWAAGVSHVLLPPGAVDPTNPKVVRAGMGAHFHVPIHKMGWSELWEWVGEARIWLAEANRGQSYDEVDWRGDVALVVGGEASGAGEHARRTAEYVHIPMASGVESLNAAIAAAILLFEAARQRRPSPAGLA